MGKVEIYEKNSVEGAEIMAKVKSAEERMKDMFGKRFNQIQKEKDGQS
jgi:hypothetical protein